jgi:hypothetical protein
MPTFGTKPPSRALLPSEAYVYAVLVDDQLRYIGKGRGRRAWDHIRDAKALVQRKLAGLVERPNKKLAGIASALGKGKSISICVFIDGLDDELALAIETEMIAKHSGQIWNLAAGGEGLTPEVAALVNSDPDKRARAGSTIRALWADDAFKARALEARKGTRTPEGTASAAKALRQLWDDPAYRDRVLRARADQRAAAGKSEGRVAAGRAAWTPEKAAVMREASLAAIRTPEYRAARSAVMKERWAAGDPALVGRVKRTPEQIERFRLATIERNKTRFSDPEYKARVTKKISESLKRRAAEKRGDG